MSSPSISTQESINIDIKYMRAKYVLDLVLLLITALLVVPVSVIIVILIRLDSEGSAIIHQKRVGINCFEFEMLKFRSMYEHNDETIHYRAIEKYIRIYALNCSTHAPYKLENDPRVTRIGRFIRKTSLDELPQFWNVLRGDMTMVGPRPPLPYEVELYNTRDWCRLSGKPGVTGPWQVYGRNRVTFQEMVEMDIAYLQQQSIWEDIKLIVRTVPVMLQGKGE